MTARKTLVGTGFDGKRPDPEEQKIPDHHGDVSQTTPKTAPEHEDVPGEPPPAPDSEDSEPRGPKSK
jgi:hypothetical protein